MKALTRAICVELHCGTLAGTLSLSSLALFDYVSLIDNTIIYGLVSDLRHRDPRISLLVFLRSNKIMVYDRAVQNTKLRYFCKARCALFSLAISNFLEKLGENYIKSPAPGRKYERIQGFTKSSSLGFIGLTLKDIQPI